MLSAENIASIESEGRKLARAARRDPDRAVPQYPGWSLADLASHTASIHGRTVLVCEQLPSERISAPRLPEGADPVDWYEENLESLITALEHSDPSRVGWVLGSGQTVGFWETRMVVETGVHRWDAEDAFDEAGDVTSHVALTGLDEFDDLWLPHLGQVGPLRVTAEDLGRTWLYGSGEEPVEVSGTASDLYLRLVGRPSDIDLPDEWATAIDSLAPPPKR